MLYEVITTKAETVGDNGLPILRDAEADRESEYSHTPIDRIPTGPASAAHGRFIPLIQGVVMKKLAILGLV